MEIGLVASPVNDSTVYVVLEDLGNGTRVWRETHEQRATEQAVIDDILAGKYRCPLRIVAFDAIEGWSLDVTREIAAKLLDAAGSQGRALGPAAWDFVERTTSATRPNDPSPGSSAADASA